MIRPIVLITVAWGLACAHPPPSMDPEAPPSATGEPSSYAEELIGRARERDVAASRGWLRLGHWNRILRVPGLSSTPASQADEASFFLAPKGKTDPQAELEASLRAFFAPGGDESGDEDPLTPPSHAVCRFPARFLFLRDALDIDLARMRIPRCVRFQNFVEEIQPASATLVFSSYFMNNPASAFGHTFLRINRAQDLEQGERKELLDAGIDFGANVDTDNAFLYGLKGLFGLFPATFRRMPYYYKVRQYGDYESRDIWEYDLELTDAQRDILIAHLWELGYNHFDYWYLTENCSYHILGVIAAAVPEADLLERVHVPVIPADTIKAVQETPGLVSEIHYRPSIRAQLRARLAELDREERSYVARVFDDPETPLPSEWTDARRIAVLDTAADLVDMRHGRALLEETEDAPVEKKQRILERRSDIRSPSPPLVVEVPARKEPHRGHGSRRIGLGAALTNDRTPGIAVDLRLAFHDLADPSDGYPELSQIEFFAGRFRVSTESSPDFTLDDFALVRATSISSVDLFSALPSWTFSLGAETAEDGGCGRCLVGNARFGGGLARAWRDESITLFGRVDSKLQMGDIDGIGGAPLRAGFGPAGGLRLRLHPRLIWLNQGEWLWLPGQQPRSLWKASSILRWGLTRDWALSTEGHARDAEQRVQMLLLFYL
ncbi:MAG: DUF4105 domain-containing protein [Deltaproteobacteria bacterium]|nr:DUF4105 domain-containing protein [Deltaproteobacteria bacterium]